MIGYLEFAWSDWKIRKMEDLAIVNVSCRTTNVQENESNISRRMFQLVREEGNWKILQQYNINDVDQQ